MLNILHTWLNTVTFLTSATSESSESVDSPRVSRRRFLTQGGSVALAAAAGVGAGALLGTANTANAAGGASTVGTYSGNTTLPTARLDYFDRNPTHPFIAIDVSQIFAGPYSEIVLWTYTVPAGRVALVGSLMAIATNLTQGTVYGVADGRIYLNNQIFHRVLMASTAGASSQAGGTLVGPWLLKAGDVLKASIQDGGSGDNVVFCLNAAITEFDP